MDQNDLLAIGRFADITGLSVHTLRHYDDVGLLAPAEVDASSGYRRYSRNQIALARLIKALRRVELPVEDVRAVLADPDSPHATNTLIRHRDRLVAQHAQMSHQIDDVEEFIKRGIFMSRKPVYSGKVRDIYAAGDDKFLFVASDRLSVFDVVLNEPVPDKGRILTAMTHYWLNELRDLAPNHMVSCDPAEMAAADVELEPDDAGRAMLVKKADMLLVECIVRGYITGSAWSEYKQSGTMNGTPLPAGIQESEQLPEPVFTPSTKAELGDHDVNISFEDAVNIIGRENAERGSRPVAGLLRAGVGASRRARDHHRRHQIRTRLHRRGARAVRRSAHAGLEPVLACRRVEAGSDAPELRQTTGARPARGDGLGQEPSRTADHRRCGRRHPQPLHRGVRDHHRSQVQRLVRSQLVASFNVLVEVKHRAGVADPQGATVEKSLPTLGFTDVSGVHMGKAIRFHIEAADEAAARARVEDLCTRFLTNPVIEDAVISFS